MNHIFIFIVNSRIGTQKIIEVRQAIQTYLPNEKYEIFLTEYAGHATFLAKQAIENPQNIIVAVGGDGTVNEVVQVLANTNIPMAVVPTGSGNGLARHCKIPTTISLAIALLKNYSITQIDLGKANDKFFISNTGVGFDAWVCSKIKETINRGLKMYILEVVKNYFTYKKETYTIISDEKSITEEAFFLNIANGKEFGYGFEIAPNASLCDGMLDVIIVKNMNLWTACKFVVDGWQKKLHTNKNCIYFQTKKISIRAKNLHHLQVDGDAHSCMGICEIKMIPKALRLIIPPNVSL